MSENSQDNETGSLWLRLLYMVLFMLIFGVAEFVLYIAAALGFLFRLFGKSDNSQIRDVGHYIALYIKEIADYLTFNTEVRPFPFSEWPDDKNIHPTQAQDKKTRS